ncbi:Lysophospholipase, alpha-beta hydrolase superfamily [Lentibacillus halodurans]|uniref:Lysophospholipase, alpha-beta hydrolase superfamily n=1 Tax=Lentibacillus halodurans TaxID=237679 RepID=A0A1I0WM54_9BACI|nr:alpha/beta hydrolase [Lentibacillus halodurans]SFA89701.1 Lysophospholipase, alpha-beta hydrolase superfamily [Lentibacillus halodurans]
MEKTFWFTQPDNIKIYVKKWFTPENKPKAIVQIAHGMAEHIGRYDDFADFLVENNIFVYGNDHRGHGKTGEKQGILGYFADENGFETVTDDLYAVTKQIRQHYPDTSLFLLGHSMGSFLTRHFIQVHSELVDGVILTGTGHYSRFTSETARRIAANLPPKEKSGLMNALVFSSFNKRVQNKKTKLDWLSRDDRMIQSYIDDPYCGFIPTAGFFKDLMTGLTLIHDQKRNRQIRSDLPMLIAGGNEDPVGDYAKGVWKTAELYNDAGLNDIMTILFEKSRHELLNERNRDEIYRILLNWVIGLTSKIS